MISNDKVIKSICDFCSHHNFHRVMKERSGREAFEPEVFETDFYYCSFTGELNPVKEKCLDKDKLRP